MTPAQSTELLKAVTYQNHFYNPKYQDSKPVIYPAATPVEYNGYLIYKRSKEIFDIVADGVCVGMYAGLNGAKKAIDEKKIIPPALVKRKRA